jgi:uracil-DNA glycosylase
MNIAPPLTAEHYWSADQLCVMRGLALPTWFRPFTDVQEATSNESVDQPPPQLATLQTQPLSTPLLSAVDLASLAALATNCQNCALGQSSTVCRKPLAAHLEPSPVQWLIVIDDATQSDQLLSPEQHRLLGNMLASVGKAWHDVSITPVLKCVNTLGLTLDAFSEPIQACQSYLQQQLIFVKPQLIIAMGSLSAQTLLGVEDDLEQLMTELHEYEGLPLLVLPHPAALLKQVNLKAQVWRDINRF